MSKVLQRFRSVPQKLIFNNRKIHSFNNNYNNKQGQQFQSNNAKSTLNYLTAAGVLAISVAYAFVPTYRMYCKTRFDPKTHRYDENKVENLSPIKSYPVAVKFNADTVSSMRWNFKPLQKEITVYPGETALAFYTAENPFDKPITGISTYNIIPFEAAQYFNKIQCFCFEEQQLNPHEKVDMPVFFYIDPEYTKDARMRLTNDIVLSYTFFEVKDAPFS